MTKTKAIKYKTPQQLAARAGNLQRRLDGMSPEEREAFRENKARRRRNSAEKKEAVAEKLQQLNLETGEIIFL